MREEHSLRRPALRGRGATAGRLRSETVVSIARLARRSDSNGNAPRLAILLLDKSSRCSVAMLGRPLTAANYSVEVSPGLSPEPCDLVFQCSERAHRIASEAELHEVDTTVEVGEPANICGRVSQSVHEVGNQQQSPGRTGAREIQVGDAAHVEMAARSFDDRGRELHWRSSSVDGQLWRW